MKQKPRPPGRLLFLAALLGSSVAASPALPGDPQAEPKPKETQREPQAMPREELVEVGKAATVLVETSGGNYGSAFCVHSTGFFVTNDHVTANVAGKVKLVLHPSLPEQKVLEAIVARHEPELDLALLRVEGVENLPVLCLGSSAGLHELLELVAFGYPFGRDMATDKDAYPAITVNTGSIASLRRKEGDLFRIQLDASLNPGNSGGPLLDSAGQVVGIIAGRVEGPFGAGINLAIPVDHLSRFLARPEIVFTPPVINEENQHEPVWFVAKTVSVLPESTPLQLDLVLSTGLGDRRRMPMEQADGAFRAEAVPVLPSKGPPPLRVVVQYEDGFVSGSTEDRDLKVGDTKIRLGQVRGVRLKPKGEVVRSDGTKLEGEYVPLREISVKVGGQTLNLDLSSALGLAIEAPDETIAVSCTVVARQGSTDIAYTSVPVFIEGVGKRTIDTLAEGKFVKPPRTPFPVSCILATSSPGDYIGEGKSYFYGPDDFRFQRSDRGVQIQVGNPGGWTILFGAPVGRFLEVGEYLDAKRYPFSEDSPGIEFYGHGRGCNTIAGKFVVWELEVSGNEIVRLAIDFIQRCEEKMPPLYGTVRIRSSFH